MPQVALAHDREQAFCRNHSLGSAESMLEHGASTDEVHILLWKSVAAQILNERSQQISLPSSQYDSASSWNSRFGPRFEKHCRYRRAIIKPAELKQRLYSDAQSSADRFLFLPSA